MIKVEEIVNDYISELSSHLNYINEIERENLIEEVRDHLYLFIKDEIAKGCSETEIEKNIYSQFSPPIELANQILKAHDSESFNNKKPWSVLIITLVFLISPIIIPELGTVPLAFLLFLFSYLVLTKKYLWVFYIVKKNNHKIINHNKIALMGGFYLIIVGMLILFGNLINIEYIIGVIIFLFLSFSIYIKRKFIY